MWLWIMEGLGEHAWMWVELGLGLGLGDLEMPMKGE